MPRKQKSFNEDANGRVWIALPAPLSLQIKAIGLSDGEPLDEILLRYIDRESLRQDTVGAVSNLSAIYPETVDPEPDSGESVVTHRGNS